MIHNSRVRIMVFGTFDILHKGHLDFFRQARQLSRNPFLIVSVARDVNVKKIKGFKPKNSEKKRLVTIKRCNLADRAVLGGKFNHLIHILKEKPAIIGLGYDQKAYIKGLRKSLMERGLKVKVKRLKAYKPNIYKSSLIK